MFSFLRKVFLWQSSALRADHQQYDKMIVNVDEILLSVRPSKSYPDPSVVNTKPIALVGTLLHRTYTQATALDPVHHQLFENAQMPAVVQRQQAVTAD